MTIAGIAPNGPQWGYELLEEDVTISIDDIAFAEDYKHECDHPSFSWGYPIAIERKGNHFIIIDGCHRLAEAMRAGETSVIVNIYKSI